MKIKGPLKDGEATTKEGAIDMLGKYLDVYDWEANPTVISKPPPSRTRRTTRRCFGYG